MQKASEPKMFWSARPPKAPSLPSISQNLGMSRRQLYWKLNQFSDYVEGRLSPLARNGPSDVCNVVASQSSNTGAQQVLVGDQSQNR
jgi:hypothetical protein